VKFRIPVKTAPARDIAKKIIAIQTIANAKYKFLLKKTLYKKILL